MVMVMVVVMVMSAVVMVGNVISICLLGCKLTPISFMTGVFREM